MVSSLGSVNMAPKEKKEQEDQEESLKDNEWTVKFPEGEFPIEVKGTPLQVKYRKDMRTVVVIPDGDIQKYLYMKALNRINNTITLKAFVEGRVAITIKVPTRRTVFESRNKERIGVVHNLHEDTEGVKNGYWLFQGGLLRKEKDQVKLIFDMFKQNRNGEKLALSGVDISNKRKMFIY